LEKQLKFSVLDNKRKEILPLLREFKGEFYLAGGTALALQIGHRRSDDFDFFSFSSFELKALQKKTESIFKNLSLSIIQLEKDTFSIIIDEDIKVSFFKIEQKILLPVIESKWFQILSEAEIGAMKIAALLRAAFRDYVDLYFLLKKYDLKEILSLCEKKYPGFEKSVYLKALLSYDDIEIAPIQYLGGKEKSPEEVFSFIEKQTKLFLSGR
jgi:Nucleotidyl transferase AbiEii toxin, Type IV TA system